MSTPTLPEPLSVACGYCAVPAGHGCESATGRPCEPHSRRVKLARAVTAHADPVLDAHFARLGPCGICGTPGLDQRHRVIDAMAEQMTAGEPVEDVAADYGVPAAAGEVVLAWALRWPGVWL